MCADWPWLSRHTYHVIGKYNNKGQYLIHQVYICANLNSPFVVQDCNQLSGSDTIDIHTPSIPMLAFVSTNLLQDSIDKAHVDSDQGAYRISFEYNRCRGWLCFQEGEDDEDITMVDTPMTFPTSNFKSSSTPTSIQIRNSGAAHTKTVTQVAYVLRFGRSTYAWKAKEISFPMDPAPCKNSSRVNRNYQNNMTSRICQGATPPSFGLLARVPSWPKWWTPPWPPPETLRRPL